MSPCWSWGLNPGLQNSSQLLRAWGHLHLLTPHSGYSSSEAAKLLAKCESGKIWASQQCFSKQRDSGEPLGNYGVAGPGPLCSTAHWSPLRNPSASWAQLQHSVRPSGFPCVSSCNWGGEWVTAEDEQRGRTGFPLWKIWIYFCSFIASQNPFSSFLFFHAVTSLKSMVHLTSDFHLIPFKVI